MSVGFIGLGNMGCRMAAKVKQAYPDLVVYDIEAARMEPFVADGAIAAASPADLMSKVDLALCSLPTPQASEAVALGANGLIEGGAGKTVVDFSTIGPRSAKLLSEKLAEKGITFLDAPVSGGVKAAEAGTLTLMVAGPPAQFEEARPVLDLIGKRIFFVGKTAGSGQTVKLCNNLMTAISAVASFEVIVMAEKAGVPGSMFIDIVNASSGRNFITEERIPQCVLNRTFPMRFATELLAKDVNLAVHEAEMQGSPLWMGHAARNFLSFAMSQGDGPRDYAELIRHFEGWSNVQVGGVRADNSAEA